MSHLPRILEAVYHRPWLITAEGHATVRRILDSRLANDARPLQIFDRCKPGETDLWGEPLPAPRVVDGISVIPIKGTVMKGAGAMDMSCGAVSTERVVDWILDAVADPGVEGILLDVNSPGGYAVGVHEAAQEIASARKEKPVMAYVDELSASAAYYLAAGVSAIYAAPSSKVGSIGTYAYLLDTSAYYAAQGVKPEVIVSAGSTFKAAGAPGTSLTPDQRANLQASVDHTNARFKGFVKSMRPQVKDDAMRGQCFDGDQSAEQGLIDSEATWEQAFSDLLKMAKA
jgi:signal peptide peptidase SppA